MIRNVVFDMGGVLVDLDLSACVHAFMSLSPDPLSVMERLKKGDMLGDGGQTTLHDYELGNISTEEYVDGILRECKEGVTREMVIDAFKAVLRDVPQPRRRAILELRKKGYNVYLLSNINDVHWPMCRAFMETPMPNEQGECQAHLIGEFFNGLFLSHEMHLCKPDPKIYDTLIAQTGVCPSETLYFDDVEANVQSGLAAGLQAVQAIGDEWIPIVNDLPAL